MVVLVILGNNSYRTNLSSFERLNEENLGWSAARLGSEYVLFLNALSDVASQADGGSVRAVNNRFDILWSRMATTETGVVGERLRAYDTQDHLLVRLFDLMRREEAAVVNLSRNDTAEVLRLHSAFSVFRPEILAFERSVFFGEQAEVSAIRRDLRQSANFVAIATIAAFLIGGALVALLTRESARNRKMADDNLKLADAARAANAAKSRFLTMMSHELRTPMNGVLGMLSLTRKSGLTVPQMRLVEQAERSGQQMIAMLGDILDYSALQDEQMTIERKPFEPRNLARAVHELFSSVARREGIEFDVRCDEACPSHVVGDFKRLRQVIAHFSGYIVETAGTAMIEIVISHDGGALSVHINLDHRLTNISTASEDNWLPSLLLGKNQESREDFATDALGPSVSRGILDRMGGTIALDHSNGKISIVITVPAPVFETGAINVFLDTRSEALRAICALGLAEETFNIVEIPEAQRVHTVLLEAGGHDEMERVQSARKRCPNALLIAVGRPTNPQDFDDIMELPLDVQVLRASVSVEQSA